MAVKALLVEDDTEILQLLKVYFEAKGHEVIASVDGVTALEEFRRAEPDVVILDIGLPRLDGWSVLEAIRAGSDVPVILLTSHDGTEDVVRGLSLGADDYLSKPFQVRELDARIEAVCRRVQCPPVGGVLEIGPIRIDDRAKLVTVNGGDVLLTPKEYYLLRLLASDTERVFSNEEILARVWPDSSQAMATDVKQYVHRLRRKVGAAGTRIKTIKGFGYRLVFERA